MGKYITTTDIETAVTRKLLLEIFDDTNAGVLDNTQVEFFINMGEAEVDSRLFGFYTMELTDAQDRMVRLCALDYTIHFIYERHPEAVQQFGDAIGIDRYKRAEKRMDSIQSGLKRLTENTPSNGPLNMGGIVYDAGPRLITDSADGSYNGGDF